MLKLTLHILLGEGRHRTVFDYVLGTDQLGLERPAICAGAIDSWSRNTSGAGLIPTSQEGRMGRLKGWKIKPASGQYGAGNQVVDYIPREVGTDAPARTLTMPPRATLSREKMPAGDIDDEIPF